MGFIANVVNRFKDSVQSLGHIPQTIAHNITSAPVRVANVIQRAVNFVAPSAQVGGERRIAAFGTSSKLPAIATAGVAGAISALALPEVAGATVAREAAVQGENLAQTALRYITTSPLTNIAEGNFAGLVKGMAQNYLGTTAFIEGGNALQAIATGNPYALVPSAYQSASMLVSAPFPGASHVMAAFGFIGRGAKSGFDYLFDKTKNVVQNVPTPSLPIPTWIDNLPGDLSDLKNREEANAHAIADLAKQFGSAIGGAASQGFGIVMPSFESPGRSILSAAEIAALLGGAYGIYHHYHKKHKTTRHKKRRTMSMHGHIRN